MKTFNHFFNGDYDDLDQWINLIPFPSAHTVLIQYFDGMLGSENTTELIHFLRARIPNVHIIGTTTDGEIADSSVESETILLSLSLFDTTEILSVSFSLDEGNYETGRRLGNTAKSFGAQAVIAFSDAFATNGDLLSQGFSDASSGAILAGGIAADNGRFKSTYVVLQDTVYQQSLVAIMLRGNNLRVQNGFSFQWLPTGPSFRVTRSVGNRVYELDNRPIVDVYREYLGDTVADTLPSVGVAFPIVLDIDGELVGRAPLFPYEDGSIGFGGDIAEGIEVRFGIGNTDRIIAKIDEMFHTSLSFAPESTFVYSCMARRRFLGDAIGLETERLASVSSLCGFFTYGEFYTDPQNKRSMLLNETLTYLLLSESPATELETQQYPLPQQQEWSLITFSALSHLVTKITGDLQKLNESLRHQVDDQIAEIRTKDQIMIAQSKRATMGEMINMIAHQWRQPISTIGLIADNMALDVMLGDQEPHKIVEATDNIQQQIRHLSKTIDDFSSYFRPENIVEIFKVETLFTELVSIVGKSLEHHNIEFSSSIPADSYLQCNRREVIQICLNLINNAKDAITEQEIQGRICFEHHRRSGHDYLCIADNAGGIPESIGSKIFEPYFTTKTLKNGTGLGLYMSKTIAERHLGGDLTYTNNDQGAVFCLSIPHREEN